MRICYIADGKSIHTQRWVNYFARKREHEVHLISSRFPSGYKGYDKKIKIHHLVRLFPRIWKVSGYFSGILWLFQVRRLVKKIRPDVLDAHFITINGYLGAISGFHPLLLTAWGSDVLIAPKRNLVHRFLTKRVLKRADCVICWSSGLKEEALKLGAAPDKIEVAFIGVDTEKFSPKQGDRSFLQKSGISTFNSPIIMSTRNLNPIYDVETLIRAIPLVLEEEPEASFFITGEGEQKNYLENLAQELGVKDRTKFVGWISYDKLPQYLASADVYVSTSLSDGTSQSLLEAMACRLAPVVTDIGANQQWVRDGENGFLFPPKDSRILATKIVSLIASEEKRAAFGQVSRKMVVERASYEREMAKVEDIYTKVSNRKPK